MSVKEIRTKGLDIYNRNKSANWILGLSCGLLIAGLFALAVAVPILIIIIIPFLIVPIFFAGHCTFLAIQGNEKITVGKAFAYFVMYFKNPFNSSFSVTKSLLKCLLILLISLIICAPIAYSITNAVDPNGMNGLINELNDLVRKTTYTVEELNAILTKYATVVTSLSFISFLPSSFITLICGVYFISKNSVSVYYRLSCPIIDANLLTTIHKYLESKNRKYFLKNYFGLNWPLFVLLLIGFGGGVGIGLATNKDAAFTSILCGSFAFLASAFYLPFYFPNMQALYENISPLYQEATIETTNQIIKNIQERANLIQDDKTKIEVIDNEIKKDDNTEKND